MHYIAEADCYSLQQSKVFLFYSQRNLFLSERLETCNRTIKTCGWVFEDEFQDEGILALVGCETLRSVFYTAAGRRLGRGKSNDRTCQTFLLQHTAHN